MHSIVVLGDSRFHGVTLATSKDWSDLDSPPTTPGFWGGSKFFFDAIWLRLRDQLRIFSYSWPRDPNDPSGGGYAERHDWELTPVQMRRETTKAARLVLKGESAGHGPPNPPIDTPLKEALLGGTFEASQGDQSCTLPIAHELNKIRLALEVSSRPESTVGDFLSRLPAIHSLITTLSEKAREACSDADALQALLTLQDPLQEDTVQIDLGSKLKQIASRYSQICQIPQCPDIVLIDDLTLGFRRAVIPLELTDTIVDKARATLADTPSDLRSAIILLLDRFRLAQQHCEAHFDLPIMEPVIIVSVVDNPASAIEHANDDTVPFLRYVYNNPWLRARCIVLLNVADLRKQLLPISSGLSWERTAQEVIAEVKRSSRFRPFLEFGQLVIRFGQYGLLQIVRRGDCDWSYKLVFDTQRDDAGGPDDRVQGGVLGESAIVAGAIVEELVSHCNYTQGNPLLSALPECALRAAGVALGRLQRLNSRPYGSTSWRQYIALLETGCMLPRDVFGNDESSPEVRFSQVSVPPVLLRDWSIVGQTVQTRVGAVARDIVRFGVLDVLNQEPLTDSRALLSQWATITADNICDAIIGMEIRGATEVEHRWRAQKVIKDAMSQTYDCRELLRTHTLHFKRALIPEPINLMWRPFVEAMTDVVIEAWSNPGDDIRLSKIRECAISSAKADIIPSFPSGFVEPVAAPVLRYGKAGAGQESWVVDRREIEGYRTVEKLLRTHIDKYPNNTRPLCIAVFGPPGSGKSTAVKRISESLKSDRTRVIGSFNLAQARTEEEIKSSFERIRDEGKDSVPIGFFDEFDCQSPDGSPLGWLKYFLAPMEDGVFERVDVMNAVLVFAGGTKTTFNDFSLAGRSRDDQQWVQFAEAKGPDFVSRLRGHLNIIGINPADADDELYLIRRAIMIRNVLAEMQQLHEGQRASVHENLLRAVLHVPIYWHGGRSLRMLLEQCSSRGKLSAYEVPPIQQLNMLVDGKAFLDLLNNVQAE